MPTEVASASVHLGGEGGVGQQDNISLWESIAGGIVWAAPMLLPSRGQILDIHDLPQHLLLRARSPHSCSKPRTCLPSFLPSNDTQVLSWWDVVPIAWITMRWTPDLYRSAHDAAWRAPSLISNVII